MSVYLLVSAVIIIACVVFNKVSSKLGIPMLLLFILLGMFFGSDGIIKIPFDNFNFAEQICSVALIFIMFYGGFGTKWSEARPVATKAVLLSTLGVVLTAGITGLFCYFVLKIELLESLLIGSVISSTDAASVFSILRSKNLNMKYNTASLLEVESGSNDPFSYMLTITLLSLMSGSVSGEKIAYMLFAQIVYGIGIGVITAYMAIRILKRFNFATEGFDTIFIFALVLFSYAAPTLLGGNGFLSTYIFGIILGNKPLRNKKSLVHFFDGVTGLMQMVVFFLLGLLSFPSELPKVVVPALIIALFLTFVARPLAIGLLLAPFRCKLNQQILVALAGLRGAASIVFAIMAMTSPAYTRNDVFHIVFCIVLFSILLQGSLLPYLAKKLNMIDEESNVLKTFNDYIEEVPVQFIQLTIKQNHLWAGKVIRDIQLPPDTLIVQLIRGEERITPDGNTVLCAGDVLVLSAKSPETIDNFYLTELSLIDGHEWIGKNVSSIKLEPSKLVVMIQREGEIIIPNGNTTLKLNDKLVINQYV
ncbi:potassium/proton antiporter [Sporanaerobium hydrogeniformans]|uniref:Potassium/proton antiporter n=1 Tax=Sporanaerobium hydrogeniformans TaxID=3072179 RepID=A0AC61D9I0_9FIRM|nr:potassium/proton antiporter [Sporanaerobium hydrogeniformans]PHV69914.1 potassium/proton antiporter [Sporanaerobium hydrogeniformans]